ncbi:hypothetical protein [Paenibacillus tundrae]|uniref:Uncharacterized protein YcfL n=1 Tax=Paenibacillus tundrae TaxID=528187 RepID=A0ABT9W969_9BACL|nr:hypothetical protein [Paenibacillus tundrae]MDQ0169771.1 uncharacterized protein YcfL [Paenibacillus tundrae]
MELHVELIPNLRTLGGEVLDVMVHGQYVGSLLVVYRENDRLSGSLQLERGSLTEASEEIVMDKVHEYVRALVDAVEADYYEVLVNCGTLRSVLLKPDTEVEVEWYEDENRYDRDYDDTDVSAIQIIPGSQDESFTYQDQEHLLEMELVSAGRNISTYVFNDVQGQELAEATLKQYGADVQGEIHWYDEPDEQQQEIAAELLVRELDEELIDTITIHFWHQGNQFDSVEWVHRDFAGEDDHEDDVTSDDEYQTVGALSNASHYDTTGRTVDEMQDREVEEDAEDISYVMLVRKDREFREYALYLQERGGLPVGTATIDTSHPDLTGYMDYQIPGTNVQRQSLVEVLLKELDKELEFDTLHLTMLYRNQIIDEARIDR